MGMTAVGERRAWYSRNVEVHPSRFDGTGAYAEWAARADAYMEAGSAEYVTGNLLALGRDCTPAVEMLEIAAGYGVELPISGDVIAGKVAR